MTMFTYKATDNFSGVEFPAMSVSGMLFDSVTGERVTTKNYPMGVLTKEITSEEFAAMCDALGLD